MVRRLLVLMAVIGLVLSLAATALGATVTVRVEGKTQSIFGSAPVKIAVGANGRACVGAHRGTVRAFAVGAVRSNAVK